MSEKDVVVPDGWSIEPLAKCVDVLDSRRKPVNSRERATRSGDVPYYGATGQVGWIDSYLFDEELVLLGEDGAPFLDKSKPIAYVIDGKSWVNNHAHVLRARPEVTNNRYIKHYLDHFDFTHRVQGSTRDKLTQGSMNTIPVLLAPKSVQDQFVRKIDEVGKLRSSASGHLGKARQALERFRQSVLAAACSGRLTADWRETVGGRSETARQLVQRSLSTATGVRQKRTDDPWSEPDWIDLPAEWTWAPMRDLASIRGGIQKQPKRAPKSNSYPYLRVANVLRGRVDVREMRDFELFNDELEAYHLETGDLLVVEGNGSATEIGRAAIWKGEIPNCVHQNHIIRVRCVTMNPQFVELFWNSPIGAREVASLAVTSAGLYSLSTKKIGAVPIPVAPLDEQAEIVRRAAALLAAADALLNRVDRASINVHRSSQAVLAKAFRGDLVGERS